MELLRGKLVIVTNACSDIGFAISEKLVDAGVQVLGLGTKVSFLENISLKLLNRRGSFQYFNVDLSSEQDIIKAISWAKFNIGPVNVLINNAWIDLQTNLTEGRTSDWRKIVDLNVIGLNVITREAVKNMTENGINGHIIHLNVTSAQEISQNCYKLMKKAVKIFAECLREELTVKKSKIKVSTLNTGLVDNHTTQSQDLEERPKLKCEDIANALEYILSASSRVEIHELTLTAV